jgi:hypothetical protein
MKTHHRKHLVRQILAAAIGILAWSQIIAPLAAQTKPDGDTPAKRAPPAKAPTVDITLDTSQAPEMADWAAEAKARCEKFYPAIVGEIGGPKSRRPVSVTITFRKGRGVAATGGNHIMCNADWFTQHPDDYGAVIHELCHVVQAYGRPRAPSWVTEGIADYVRWFKYEPAKRRPRPNPARAKYTDSYQTTAAFFDWIVRTKDKSFVRRMNDAVRDGKYSDDLFRQYANKPLDDLWTEYIASLKKK